MIVLFYFSQFKLYMYFMYQNVYLYLQHLISRKKKCNFMFIILTVILELCYIHIFVDNFDCIFVHIVIVKP